MMMKNNQLREIKGMMKEKELLQDKASTLAEKYEDIKDRQDELLKRYDLFSSVHICIIYHFYFISTQYWLIFCFRCENLLMLVNRKKVQPSDAENIFIENLQLYSKKVADYGNQMDKLKNKLKYQQVQVCLSFLFIYRQWRLIN